MPTAKSAVADLWLSAANRAEIQKAAYEIDRILRDDPVNAGESRVVNIRIIIQPPLAAYYDLDVADNRVTVWRVWGFRRQ